MTAVSFIFSIFELNPAPFCLLDEVDAPLDDNNVIRLTEMLRPMAERVQFLFVTHNKITMEIAQQLIGVTMQEAGVSRLVAVNMDEAVELAGVCLSADGIPGRAKPDDATTHQRMESTSWSLRIASTRCRLRPAFRGHRRPAGPCGDEDAGETNRRHDVARCAACATPPMPGQRRPRLRGGTQRCPPTAHPSCPKSRWVGHRVDDARIS
ncbi:MAG: hypothetical protein IPG43_06810 [Proteobacteria bacterium]|nr:hypothetical protein [Pseudomonadota bacterium]